MVIRNIILMPDVLLVLLLALVISTPLHSQSKKPGSELTVLIPATEKQWGQYLRVTLRYRGSKKLEDIDLQTWQILAAISFENEYSDEDDHGNPLQILQLRLQPRKTGRFQMPPLKLGKAYSQAVSINITAPVVNNAAIKLNRHISTDTPWQREAVIIRIQIQTPDYAAHIKLQAPQHPKFLSRVLTTERHILAGGGYRFDTGWILYPLESGLQTLDLPPVNYQIAGSNRRQFYLPVQKFQVKALPNYLPPTLPVGKLKISSRPVSAPEDGEQQWQLDIRTAAIIPYGIAGLDTQLAVINGKKSSAIVISNTQQSAYNDPGDHSIYTAPLPDWLLPFGPPLKLTLRFFDTTSGRLSEISHDLPRQWKMPAWAWWLMATLLLIAGIITGRHLQPRIRQWHHQQKQQRRIQHATDITQLRRIILHNGQYLNLSEWAKTDHQRKTVSQQLNYYCFSATGRRQAQRHDIQQLKYSLLKHL